MPLSKTQIDRLGDRLKNSPPAESDLRLLDEYRRSFIAAYKTVVRTIGQQGWLPTGRPAKSTISIVEKLCRESIRLSQMQDIAGCRVVVRNIVEQEQFLAWAKIDFPGASIVDRRENPNCGYRAVHIVAKISEQLIEIQVRTSLQHLWAELSEKSSDIEDPTIKYGGGSDYRRHFLTKTSESVAAYEQFEIKYFRKLAAKDVAEAAHEALKNATALLSDKGRAEWEESTRQLKRLEREHQYLQRELSRLSAVNTGYLMGAIYALDERRLKG